MRPPAAIADALGAWAGTDGFRRDVAATVVALTEAGREIADLIAFEPLDRGAPCQSCEGRRGGDRQPLAGRAGSLLLDALKRAPVASVALSTAEAIVETGKTEALCAAVVPLNGAADLDANETVGTVFSLLPAIFDGDRPGPSSFLQPGARQVAAGYIMYGPRTTLVLTVGEGTHTYVLNGAAATFERMGPPCDIPVDARSLTVSASDSRHWEDAIKSYVEDRLEELADTDDAGFQMHRNSSLVADCHRILHRGGTQLYPAEVRERGTLDRLGLVFEANPIALLVEQAGGAASTGTERTLAVVPSALRQRTPFVFGAHEEVARIERYQTGRYPSVERSPLFFRRGLFLA